MQQVPPKANINKPNIEQSTARTSNQSDRFKAFPNNKKADKKRRKTQCTNESKIRTQKMCINMPQSLGSHWL